MTTTSTVLQLVKDGIIPAGYKRVWENENIKIFIEYEDVLCTYSIRHNKLYFTKLGTEYFHRLDGPAYIDLKINIQVWYYEGRPVPPLTDWAFEHDINLKNPSDIERAIIHLHWYKENSVKLKAPK